MSRVAIIGAGNLGSFLAAHLQLAGHDVFFCVRRAAEEVRIEGLPPVRVPYYLDHPPAADVVLLTVKVHDTPAAMRWLARLCPEGQPVAVIQNGVHHAERVQPYRAIPVLSYVYIEAKDGVHRAFVPPRAHFTAPAAEESQPFVSLFAGSSVEVHMEPEFHTAAWRKMLHNCVSNPLTALAGRGLEILAEPEYRGWAEQILAEAATIAIADGAKVTAEDAGRVLAVLASYPAGTRTSMLQDRERGKRMELDALNGALVELGRRYGVATPVNEALMERILAVKGY